MLSLALTPEGVAVFEGEAGSAAERLLLQSASPPCTLAGELLTAELEPSLRWLRELGRQFFIRLCQTKDATRMAPLTGEETAALLACAPPFPGAEHLSAEVLERWWRELAEHIEAEAGGDVGGWLGVHAPHWHAVGRVTFHLAENKADTLRPFAFLATFTEKLGEGGRPQHLPLARALQLYAGQKDPTALNALLEPVRLAAEKSPLVREWLESKRLFQAVAMTPQEAWRVLREAALLQECGIIMKLPDWWRQGRTARPLVQVTLEAPGKATLNAHSLLGFSISRSLDGEPLGEDEWRRLMSAETGLVSLRGRWVEVDGEKLRQVMAHWQRVQEAAGEGGLGFLQGMRLLAGFDEARAAVADEGGARVAEWSSVKAGEKLAEVLQKLREPQEEPPPEGLCAVLRPYQLRGYAWLRFMTRAGLGACLADDMGLGKTLQVIALLLARRMAAAAPALLVVPASLIGNWRAEAARFAPDLRMFIAHPSVQPRETLELAASHPAEALRGQDVMLTTYQMLQRTEAWLEHGWSLVVLDEAQAVKNSGSAAAKAVKRLKAPARVALTGTPVENRPGDLWSLFDFLNPGLLGGATAFAEAVKRCAGSKEGYAPLRRLVQPFILRRMKTDRSIISDLPEKIELKAFCGLTKRQATIYAKLADQLAKMLNDPNMEPVQRQGLVLGFLLKFKQVCNHPSHWNGDGAWNAADSGKFTRLAEIAAEIAAKRERVLVFTQFQEVCEPVARFLAGVFGREGLVLHGATPVARRPHLVEAFQKPGGPPFMVISVKAGGTGLNLTAASQVIHFDRWWNPAVENQATDRAFRIGQRRNVIVHKFICQGTLEQRIDALIDDKLALARDLVGEASGAEQTIAGMGDDELLDLVRLDMRALAGD
ncbi:MAG: RNA polymerase-associated protein RapA [Prosthecobacter sp.]|nr:RNA polymerase-associated protein RapA [Prosthecobacter sp.]